MDVTIQEQLLFERVKQGDQGAFAALVDRHQRAVFGYLCARMTQVQDAEDLTQEVFLRCYQTRARFDSVSLVRPWLIGIARNVLREHCRRTRRRKEVGWTELCLEFEECALGAEEAPYEEALVHLGECLHTLGPSARQAIDLHYGSRLKLAEIGERLHRSVGAVKLLVFRARQALRFCLDRKTRRSSDD